MYYSIAQKTSVSDLIQEIAKIVTEGTHIVRKLSYFGIILSKEYE